MVFEEIQHGSDDLLIHNILYVTSVHHLSLLCFTSKTFENSYVRVCLEWLHKFYFRHDFSGSAQLHLKKT